MAVATDVCVSCPLAVVSTSGAHSRAAQATTMTASRLQSASGPAGIEVEPRRVTATTSARSCGRWLHVQGGRQLRLTSMEVTESCHHSLRVASDFLTRE